MRFRVRFRVLLAFICLSSLQGCVRESRAELSDAERRAIAEAVQQRMDGYCKGDLDFLNGFWADTPGFVIAADGGIQEGYSYIRDANRTWFAEKPQTIYCSMSNGHVYVLSPEAASLATEFKWGIVTAAGDTVESYGSWMYVFAFLDGQWRVVHSAGTHNYR